MNRQFSVMLAFLTVVIAMLSYMYSVQAADVVFFNERDTCSQGLDHLWCSNVDICSNCCYAHAPFCGRLSCDDCDGTDLHGFLNSGSCSDAAPKVTACENQPSNTCCNDLGDVPMCSGQLWSKAFPRSFLTFVFLFLLELLLTGPPPSALPGRRILH